MAWAIEKRRDVLGHKRFGFAFRVGEKIYYSKKNDGTWPTKREAVRAGNAEEKEAREPGAVSPDRARTTYGAWWTEFEQVGNWSQSTREQYTRTHKNHIAPYWDHKEMSDITELGGKKWLKQLEDNGVGETAIHLALTLFKSSLNAAVGEILKTNPLKKLTYKITVTVHNRFLDVDEFLDLLFFVQGFRDRAFLLTRVSTGTRIGEAAGIHISPDTLDLKRRRLHIVEQYHPKERVVKALKDRESRMVPIPEHLVPVLERLVDEQPAAETCGVRHINGKCRGRMLFALNGKPLNGDDWADAVFRPAKRLAGLDGRVVPYTLRHTYASWLAQDGHSMQQIAELLGHSTEGVTKLYAHLSPGGLDVVAASIDRMFGAAPAVSLDDRRKQAETQAHQRARRLADAMRKTVELAA